VCVLVNGYSWYTIQHRTVLVIFPLILQTIITAQMIPTGEREKLAVPERQTK